LTCVNVERRTEEQFECSDVESADQYENSKKITVQTLICCVAAWGVQLKLYCVVLGQIGVEPHSPLRISYYEADEGMEELKPRLVTLSRVCNDYSQ
jgi:hypothetical protein